MDGGWIKLHRKLVDWEWYKNNNTKIVFLHLLLTCNYEDKVWNKTVIRRGQRVISIKNLAAETKLSIQQIRTSLSNLQNTHEITIKSTNKFSVVTIEKFNDYQDIPTKNNTQTNTKATRKLTTTKEIKKKRNKEYILYSFENLKKLNGLYDN